MDRMHSKCSPHDNRIAYATQLIAVLALSADELPKDEDRAHALRVFLGLLTTQEHKLDAVAEGACAPVTALVATTKDAEVLRLACEVLGSLSQVGCGNSLRQKFIKLHDDEHVLIG